MKYIFIAVVSLINFSLFAQSPRFIYPVADNNEIEDVSFSRNNRLVLTRADEAANVWELASGRLLYSQNIDYNSNIEFSDDGRFVASGYNDGILVTEIRSGKQYSINTGNKSQQKIKFSHNGAMILASGSGNNSLKLWANPSGKFIGAFKGYIDHVAFSSSDRHLIIGVDGRCEKWDLQNMTLNQTPISIKLDRWVRLSTDGEFITIYQDSMVYVCNFNSTAPAR